MTCVKGSGVYKITCLVTGGFYIGSAKNFSRRWSEHRRELCKGSHVNKPLQAAWGKYTESAFEFAVLEPCDFGEVLVREQFYIDSLNPPFNTAKIAGRPPGIAWTPELRAKKRETSTGLKNHFWGEHHTDATKKTAAVRHAAWIQEHGHPMQGRAWSGDKVAHSQKLKKLHADGVVVSWQRGRPFSETQKQKQRETITANGGRRGVRNPRFRPELSSKYTAVEALIKQGSTITAACATVGMSRITYYKRKAMSSYD